MQPHFLKWLTFLFFQFFVQIICNSQIINPLIFAEMDLKTGIGDNPAHYSVSNQHGIFTKDKNTFLLRAGISSTSDTSKKISLAMGLDAIYRYNSQSDLWLQQFYLKIKTCFLVFQGGYMEETFGNQYDLLSSGSFLYSNNARPIPKIGVNTNDYVKIPFTNDLFEIKAGISHGWFGEKDQYVSNTYLHHKYLYMRVGHGKFPVSFNLGLQHAAIWGGTLPDGTKLPTDWSSYKSVFMAKMKGKIGPDREQKNVLGNHLASYSLGIDSRLKKINLNFYWQTILEDKNGRVGVDWKNKGDGLWGITIEPTKKSTGLKKIAVEFFNSTSQSGDTAKSGNDDYFNNGLYRSGWTYHQMTIGTPLITSPIYTDSLPGSDQYIVNNSVRAITTAFLYEINGQQIIFKLTYSRNYGTILHPFPHPKDQIYSAIDYSYSSKRYPNLHFTWQAAFDIGSHLGNNAGVLLKIRKVF